MAKKQKTPEQKTLSDAWNAPVQRWRFSRSMSFGPGWWTDYNEVSIGVGSPPYKFHGEDVPESAWTLSLRLRPFSFMIFKHLTLIIWLGDKKWKKALKG